MSGRRRREPRHSLALAFIRNARSFHEMGQDARRRTAGSSAYYIAIAIELGLKAYLLHRGISDQWNRIHVRHDLSKALRCVGMAGLRDVPYGIPQLVDALTQHYASGALARALKEPGLTMAPGVADNVITHLLNLVEVLAAGASGEPR